jgi:hypothetical protein
VELGEPLDHALLQRLVWVEDQAGRPVAGEITLDDDDRSWSFTPHAVWHEGHHALVIDRRLEDLAGNRIGRPFEVDLGRTPSAGATTIADEPKDEEPLRLTWIVAPRGRR